MSAGPLSGRRIVVTRAQRQSGGLREKLEQQGAEVLLLPTIETVPPESFAPLDAALNTAATFDWLVLTSANGVRILGERLEQLGLAVELFRNSKTAVVGPSTAEAARSLGLEVDLMPERFVGEALADALAPQVSGKRVLLVRAAVSRDVVPVTLRAAGAEVTIADAYRTVVPADAAERARTIFASTQSADAVVFTSGSSVTNLLDVLRSAKLALPAEVACISIGPVTSAALREAGLSVTAEADSATLDGVVAATVRLLSA